MHTALPNQDSALAENNLTLGRGKYVKETAKTKEKKKAIPFCL